MANNLARYNEVIQKWYKTIPLWSRTFLWLIERPLENVVGLELKNEGSSNGARLHSSDRQRGSSCLMSKAMKYFSLRRQDLQRTICLIIGHCLVRYHLKNNVIVIMTTHIDDRTHSVRVWDIFRTEI